MPKNPLPQNPCQPPFNLSLSSCSAFLFADFVPNLSITCILKDSTDVAT